MATSEQEPTRDQISLQVRAAIAGEKEGRVWIFENFGPVLLLQTKHRLPTALKGVVDAEDVLHDVWVRALPNLGHLDASGGSMTRALLRYFSAAILNRVNELSRRHAIERATGQSFSESLSEIEFAEDTRGVVTKVHQSESALTLLGAINEMDPMDREILILRGVEQRSNTAVATFLDKSEDFVSRRYTRGLAKLNDRLPGSLFADLRAHDG